MLNSLVQYSYFYFGIFKLKRVIWKETDKELKNITFILYFEEVNNYEVERFLC